MAQYSTYDVVALLVSIFFPPLGVFMKRGFYSDFWINVILTILGWVLGLFHAFFVIYIYRDESNPIRNRSTHAGSRPQNIRIRSTDQNKPSYISQYPSQNYQQPNYQSQNQFQYQPHHPHKQQFHTPPSTPPPYHENNYAGTSNEVPPAYNDHGNDKKLKGSYYSGDNKKF